MISSFNIKRISLLIIAFIAVGAFSFNALLVTQSYAASNAEKSTLSNAEEDALFAENWELLVTLLNKVSKEKLSPIQRFLKAHACLATNRNNESIQLFAELTLKDLETLQKWNTDVLNKTSNKSLVNYFLGDIHAKGMDNKNAIKYFSLSISQNPKNYLAYNARGVVNIIDEKYDDAVGDLLKAESFNKKFADSYNNLAMMNIRKKNGVIGNSINNFDIVLKLNPEFALAYHGMGCLELISSSEIIAPASNSHIQKALSLLSESSLVPILIANEIRYNEVTQNRKAIQLFAAKGAEGTSIKKEYLLKKAVEDADIAYEEAHKPTLFARWGGEERLRQANDRVTSIAMNMNNSELDNVKKNDPFTLQRADVICGYSKENYQSIKTDAESGAAAMLGQELASKVVGWFTPAPFRLQVGALELGGKFIGAGYQKTANEAGNIVEKINATKTRISQVRNTDNNVAVNVNKGSVNVPDYSTTSGFARETAIKPSVRINPTDKNNSVIPGGYEINSHKDDGSKVVVEMRDYTNKDNLLNHASATYPEIIKSSGGNFTKPLQSNKLPDNIDQFKVSKSINIKEFNPSSSIGNIGTSGSEGAGANSTNSPGGATTDKNQITWNEGEWPFNPIFGLLYQISYLPNK